MDLSPYPLTYHVLTKIYDSKKLIGEKLYKGATK
jgi:hypothetical protein